MARLTKIIRETKKLPFSTRYHNRCHLCGRGRSYMRLFGLCRLCFRKLADTGMLPGVKKATW